jgi:hypothetical protein
MYSRVLSVALLTVGCSAAPRRAAVSQEAVVQADSAAIVRAVWAAATDGWRARAARQVLWLWAPSAADTTQVVPLSPAVRDALVRQGVPASARRPAGDDTVVMHLTAWQADSGGVDVEVVSGWTVVLGSGSRRCRAGSGNVERFAVRRRGGGWAIERARPILHGDRVCAPIP